MRWIRNYNMDQRPSDKWTEEKFGKVGHLTKPFLGKLAKWKFQGTPVMLNRRERILSRLEPVPEPIIKQTFEKAILESDEESRLRLLDGLPGIGPAMVSVILTAYNPESYRVFDTHAWKELYRTKLKDGITNLMKFLEDIRHKARAHGLPARDVEKALFQRNYKKA